MIRKYINLRIEQTSSILGLDLPYFIKGGFWLVFGNVVQIAAGLFLSSLFSRIWPKDVYGQFSFLTSAIGFLGIFALSGMTEAVFQGSIENKDGTYKNALKKVIIGSFVATFILILGSIYFYLRQNPNLAFSVLFASIAFPFSSLGSLIVAFYSGKRNFRMASLISISANLFSVIATAVSLYWFRSLVTVTLFSTWSTAIINIFFVLKTFKDVKNRKSDEKLIQYGFFLSFTNFIWLGLDYADRFFIPLFLGFERNAVYAFAILVPMQIQNFFKMFVTLGQPKITAIKTRNLKKALIVKSLYLEFLILIIVVLYIFASPYIYRILYPDYSESIFLSQIFAFSLLYYPNNLFGTYLTKKRLIRESVIGTLVFAIFSFGSLLLFIYLWGLIGAVISKIFSRILQVAITQIIFLKELKKEATAPLQIYDR